MRAWTVVGALLVLAGGSILALHWSEKPAEAEADPLRGEGAAADIEGTFLMGPALDLEKPLEAFASTTIAAVDLSGDGRKEILVKNDNNVFYVFSADGALVAELRLEHPDGWEDLEPSGPAVGDLTGDGRPEVVVTNTAGWLTAFSPRVEAGDLVFERLWEKPLDPHELRPDYAETLRYGNWSTGPHTDAPPFLADVDGDGRAEVFAQLDDMPGNFKFGGDGRMSWFDDAGDGHAGPMVADLTGDGRLEVAYPSDGAAVRIFDAQTMTPRCIFAGHHYGARPGSISVSPTAADLTGDGRLELVFGMRNVHQDQDDPDWIDRSHAHFFAITADCDVLWHKTWDWGNPHVNMQPVPLDVGGDSRLELLFQDWNIVGHKPGNWAHTGDANLFSVDGRTGEGLWRVEIPSPSSDQQLAIADVTGDGDVEVLAHEVLDGRSGLSLFSTTGVRKGFLPAPEGWTVTKGPVLTDLGGNGHLDIVLPVHRNSDHCTRDLHVGCREGAIQIYRTPSRATPLYANNHMLNETHRADGFVATFTPSEGTDGVAVNVVANRAVASVEVRVEGEWQAMKRTGEGPWTAPAPTQGSTDAFRATALDGAVYVSEEDAPQGN